MERAYEILRASTPCTDYRYRIIYCSVFAKRDAMVPVSRKVLPVLSHGARVNFCPIGNVGSCGTVRAERIMRMCANVYKQDDRSSKITIK